MIRQPIAALLAAAALTTLAACKTSAPEPLILAGKGYTIFAAGDIADCRKVPAAQSGAAKTAELLAPHLAADPDARVLTLGDHTYPVGLPVEFDNCYEPTWGRFKARTLPAPGNHEYYTKGAPGYYAYFGAAAGPDRRGYYATRVGNWHLLSLNSYLPEREHRAQLGWLKEELTKNPSRCALAFFHHPRFSSGGHGSNQKMRDVWEVLADAGVDVVLSAHDHNYERFKPLDRSGSHDPKGMRQFVVGTGGAELTPIGFLKFNSAAISNRSHGVLKLVLKDNGYEWEFLPVADGEFTDHGIAACN